MGNTFYFGWEVALMEWIQSWLGPVGTVIASLFSEMGEQLVCVAVLGFLYWCWEKEYGKYVGLNVLVGITLNPMIKNIFLRRRPYFDNPGIKCLKPVERGSDIYDISAQGFSFPSGHSTNGVTLYASLGRYKKNRILMIIGIILPLFVGISRFCVGVHYPTDVICGWALGLIVIFLVPALQRAIKNRWLFYGLLVLIALWQGRAVPPDYLYTEYRDYDAIAAAHCEAPCVYLDDNYFAPLTEDIQQLLYFDEVFVTADPDSAALDEYLARYADSDEAVVYVDISKFWSSGFEPEEMLPRLLESTEYSAWEPLYTTGLSQTFLLTK